MRLPDPSRERPTIATLATAFLTALASWALTLVPDTVPAEVTTTGYALIVATLAVAVGKVAQGQLAGRWLGQSAPWATDTHQAAVAYALTLDPESHGRDRDELLARLGVDGERAALELIGIDPDTA